MRFPIIFGIADVRRIGMDQTAGFSIERDTEIARQLITAFSRCSYFELYDLYVSLVKSSDPAVAGRWQARRREAAEAAYRAVLQETHAMHGEAILQKIGWHLEELGAGRRLGGVILEDGAGLGQFLVGFARQFDTVLVVDLSLCYLILGKKLAEEHGVGNLRFFCGNVERVPICTGAVDVVHFNNMIEHVLHPDAALAEAHRVLREDGVACIISPNRYSLYVEPHFRVPAFGYFPRWARKRLAALVRGDDGIEAIRLYSLAQLRRLLHGAFGDRTAIRFLPRRLATTTRQTPLRRLVVWALRSRLIGPCAHLLLNRLLLAVMPYHVAFGFKGGTGRRCAG
jgi:SAM-dependent methyltransferase